MQPTLQKLKPGDPLNRLRSSTWNALVDNAQASRLLAGGGASWQGPGIVLVKNTSTVAIPRWGAMPITDPLFEIGDGGIEAIENALQLASGDNIELNAGRVAIPLEEIAPDRLGRAMVYGTVLARISVAHTTDTRAGLYPTRPLLLTAEGGSGTFTVGETVTQAGSTATGQFVSESGGLIALIPLTGTFNTSGAFTGGTSGATRTFTTAGTITDTRTNEVYLRSGHAGEVDILWKESGVSDPEGAGTEDNPLDLKWAIVHLGKRTRDRILAIIGTANDYILPDTTTTKIRYLYDWAEARIEANRASGNFGRYVAFSTGLSTTAQPELRAINRAEAQFLDGSTHAAGELAVPVRPGTVVELKPERDTEGNTVWVFDAPIPEVLRGIITAVSGASGSTPVVASGVTYTIRLVDRETSPSISGVRAYWGTPRLEADKIVPAAVGDACLVAQFPLDDELEWRALVTERFASASCA